jgi:hypothetical protein
MRWGGGSICVWGSGYAYTVYFTLQADPGLDMLIRMRDDIEGKVLHPRPDSATTQLNKLPTLCKKVLSCCSSLKTKPAVFEIATYSIVPIRASRKSTYHHAMRSN